MQDNVFVIGEIDKRLQSKDGITKTKSIFKDMVKAIEPSLVIGAEVPLAIGTHFWLENLRRETCL